MNLLALDLSLTATGWATAQESGTMGCTKKGLERLISYRDRLLTLAKETQADLIVLEGLAFGAHHSMKDEIAGMHYVVRVALMEAGYPVALLPPATLKKFATGRGNAKKEHVLVAAVMRLGYEGHDHNQADALWLLHAGWHHYQVRRANLPKDQLIALAKVDWPALTVEAA